MHDEGRALGVDRWIVFPFVSHLALDVTVFMQKEIGDEKGLLRDVPYAFENWFDCSAHCIYCEGVVKEMAFVAQKPRRFDTDYTDPTRVIADLAAAYPTKFCWGSDSPFYSYAAEINGQLVRLISTYAREVAALKVQPPEVLARIADHNTRAWLKLHDKSILA